jgi:hypothetical protein
MDKDQAIMIDEMDTVTNVRRMSQLDDNIFEQIGLFYYLSKTGKNNQIEHGTVSELMKFPHEGDLICAMLDIHMKGGNDKVHQAFGAASLSERAIVDDLYDEKHEILIKICSKIEMLKRRTGTKARFGNSLMLYIVLIIFIMNIFSIVSSEKFYENNILNH